MSDDDPLWYKDAVVYELHVKAFCDSNGDGLGDFPGLTEKLDYLLDLGVTAIWLLPFYPSPLRDDGYDIADYRNINPHYGSMRDFRTFVREAHKRGLKVITEVVINHTSDQHPWFQRARKAKPGSKWRDFYVWSDTVKKYEGTRIIFCDSETSNWTWDPEAGAYYWHRFFHHQPDLNFDNPRVFEEVTRVMKFWLDAGVDGLRLDAVPYLCEREGTNNENLTETHAVIKQLRAWIDANFENRMLLAEANQWPEDVCQYFGDGDECHMAYHFPLMPRMYMALAREDRYPITDIMRQTPEIPENCQWAIFLRNHDELTLEMVTDRERDYLWHFYAADSRARINLGIRRRLAPLLDRDRRKIELLNSLLMSMPGTPIIYYGDEIGMGDNVFLGDRNGVRTPMQWSPDRNAGFSRAEPESLYLPPIMDSIFGFEAVNVESQRRLSTSLLNWMKRLISVRKAHPSFGRGSLKFLYPGNRKVFAYLRSYQGETVLCVANLSQAPQPVELDLSTFRGRVPVELLGKSAFPPIGDLPYFITLPWYGFYWFLLAEEAEVPRWYEGFVTPLPEFRTLVLRPGWENVQSGGHIQVIEERVLPEFLPNQRWFAAKGRGIRKVSMKDSAVLLDGDNRFRLARFDAEIDDGSTQHYFLPLTIAWETAADDPMSRLAPYVLAKARAGGQVGAFHDALATPFLTEAFVRAMREGWEIETSGGGRMVFSATKALAEVELPDDVVIERMGREQSNTSVMIGEQMILKALRRLEPGVHPEIEIGRFLTNVAHFPNVPPLLGTLELMDCDGTPTALALLQGFVRNQGDGWSFTEDYLRRVLQDLEVVSTEEDLNQAAPHAMYVGMARTLGNRVADLHRAFALDVDDPAFQPEPASPSDMEAWGEQVRVQASAAQSALTRSMSSGDLSEEVRQQVESVLGRWPKIDRMIDQALPKSLEVMKTRHHGDLHLGQVVVVREDFCILDFEGEPVRSMEQRRSKHSPLRDVAGMIRSFNYAALTAPSDHIAPSPAVEEQLETAVRQWEKVATACFLEGYRESINGCSSVPANSRVFRRLLNLFVLEKALYEICYEAANRPDWLRIPVTGVQRLMASAA